MFDLKFRRNRPPPELIDENNVIATYTIDRDYVQSRTLAGEPGEDKKIFMAGWVVALNPDGGKIVPHYTSYGFGQLGVNLDDVDVTEADSDRVANILWRGNIRDKYLWDNGEFGSVLQATKDTLRDRIQFVKDLGNLIQF